MTATNYALPLTDDVQQLIEDVCDSIGYDAYFHRVEPISAEDYSGFIAYTDGGWDGVITFGFYGEDAYNSDIIRPYIDRDYDDMVSEFAREHELSDFTGTDIADQVTQQDWERYREQWEQGDSSEWFGKVRAIFYDPSNHRNETGEPEWLFCIGVCNDFGYGRDHVGGWAPGVGTQWLWEETVKVSDLTPQKLAFIADAMTTAWSNA